MTMTLEELARKCYTEMWSDNGTHSEEFVIGRIADALRAAVAAEREACQKAVCYGCRQDAPYTDGMHEIRYDLETDGGKSRWINCSALAIRALGPASGVPPAADKQAESGGGT